MVEGGREDAAEDLVLVSGAEVGPTVGAVETADDIGAEVEDGASTVGAEDVAGAEDIADDAAEVVVDGFGSGKRGKAAEAMEADAKAKIMYFNFMIDKD